MRSSSAPSGIVVGLVLLVGVLAASTAALFIRLAYAAEGSGSTRLGLGRYVVTAYVVGALTLLSAPLLLGSGYSGWPAEVYLYGLLAFIPQLVGHSSFNWAVRWVSSTLVALVILAEPVGGSILGYLVFGEAPGYLVVAGAAVLLTGVACAVWGEGARSGKAHGPDGVPIRPD